MKLLLLLPLLLGLMSPAIAHNENNGGCGSHCEASRDATAKESGYEASRDATAKESGYDE